MQLHKQPVTDLGFSLNLENKIPRWRRKGPLCIRISGGECSLDFALARQSV